MKKIKYAFALLLVFFFSGCYNYRELNDLAITTAVGIDKGEDGYKVSAQIVNTEKAGSDNSSTSEPKIVVYSSDGETIQMAIRKVILESPKRLYPYHMEILVISEDVAKDGINDVLDIFLRDVELRKQFYVLIAKGKAEDILKTLTPINTIVSNNILKSLKADSKYLGMEKMINFEQLMSDYINDKIEISIPSIEIRGNSEEGEKKENIEESESETSIYLSDLALFKGDKLIDYLDKEKTIFYNLIENKIKETIIEFKCDDKNMTAIEIIDSKTKVETDKSGFKINFKITGNANINEINCPVDLNKNSVIEDLQNKLNENIKKNITETINFVKEKNTDVFGFKDAFYKNNQKTYKQIGTDWYNGIFENTDIEIKSNIKLIEKGNIVEVIHEQQQ